MITLSEVIAATDATVVEQFEIPPRPERLAPIPGGYADAPVSDWLQRMTGGPMLYNHQSLALNKLDEGANVILNTSTASGKTLAFAAPIIRGLLESASSRAVLLYPQKALGGDQCARMRSALELAGLSPDLVGEINGDIPTHERFAILERCPVIAATPDVLQSWLMPNLGVPQVQELLRTIRFLVIDEAHANEGVFGSTSAFLFRRIFLAIDNCRSSDQPPVQVIAASATIRDAAEHMRLLTGREFVEVGEADNGAPFHGLTMVHVEGQGHGRAGEAFLAHLCSRIADVVAPHALIAFADNRQGVEHIRRQIGRDDVLPYRGGYEVKDRRSIERALWAGELRGVVSTSALELGVDIPQLPIGLNLGVPQTRKAFRQRVGRIGRSMPGLFVVVAPATEFTKTGGSMREFFEGEIEPSRLYLENRYIQLQAARCLAVECA